MHHCRASSRVTTSYFFFFFAFVCLFFVVSSTVFALFITASYPSKKCQRLFGQLCVQDNQLANEFLNGLLNQLNWSFSEFIGMLQEVWYSVSFIPWKIY